MKIIKDYVRNFQDVLLYLLLKNFLKKSDTVLDVGCGVNSPLLQIKKTFKSTGIDVYKPVIQESKKKNIHDSYVLGDITKLSKFFKAKNFDSVISLDVIEHLTRKEGMVLMKNMEKIAKKNVIILTPNGFYHQDHYDGNPHQEHKSGWKESDFLKLGYRVFGLRGLKYIRGECATITRKPWLFWGIIAFFSEPFLLFFPFLSYHLFAVKNITSHE